MFRIGLRELDRTGSLRLREAIPANDPLWEGLGFELVSEVHVELEMTRAGSGQIVARGRAATRVGGACGRCLAPVEEAIDLPLTLVWSDSDGLSVRDGAEEEDSGDEVRVLDPGAMEVDVGEAVREELALAVPLYRVCRPDCKGLCPRCGVDRNEASCECGEEEIDPRWQALRSVRRRV